MVDLKIATVQPIGILDEAALEPANMSSGSASANEVLTADGAGGASWSAESGLGDVTGPAGGVADSDLAVFDGTTGKVIKKPDGAVSFGNQQAVNLDVSNLDPSGMTSGSATLGQLLTAGGGGATSWADPPTSVTLPGSSTDHALTRWDSTGGDTLLDSGVTLSDAGAMLFPSGGSISKPGSGSNSEVFGAAASSANASSVAVGHLATISTPSSGDSTGAVAIGQGSQVGQGAAAGVDASIGIGWNVRVNTGSSNSIAIGADAVVGGGIRAVGIGYNCDALANFAVAVGQSSLAEAQSALALGPSSKVYPVSSGDSTGSIAVGAGAVIGNSTPGAGCNAAICIGESASVGVGSVDSVVIGAASSSTSPDGQVVSVGPGAQCGGYRGVSIGFQTNVSANRGIALGQSVAVSGLEGVSIGGGSSCAGSQSVVAGASSSCAANLSVVVGYGVNTPAAASFGVSIGRLSRAYQSTSVAIGNNAHVNTPSSGDSTGAIALGPSARVGDATPAAGCDAAVALGASASVGAGHLNSMALGFGAATTASNRVTFASTLEVEIGQGLAVWGVTPPGSQPAKITDITATAGASYTATEQGMLNDLKARVNSIIDVLEGAGLSSAT